MTTWTSWHRWTAISLLACAFLAVAAAWQRAADSSASMLELIPVTVPQLLRQLRGTAIPSPGATSRTATPGTVATPPPVPRPASPPAMARLRR